MKLRSTFLLALFFLSLTSFSIDIDWAKKISSPTQSKGLFCDKDSNVYNYGNNFPIDKNQYYSAYNYFLSDTSGSFFNKYSPDGQLLLSKRWRGISFFVQEFIYDGNAAFYFTGFFTGSITIDGITITSKGKDDGMVGKMNMSGTILWMATLGGGKSERTDGICFDGTKTNLLVTGSTTDTLYVNNMFLASAQQSTLLAKFNISGVLQTYKLWDFLAIRDNETDGNFGRKITYAGGGNYYLLSDCEGSYWVGDSISAPVQGRYLIKLNVMLDTVWRKFVIGPSCYYGWSANDLVASASFDPYTTSFCSGHYGGDGFLQKYNPVNGNNAWTKAYTDGRFNNIFTDGNNVLSVGREDAFYPPGPGMNPGNSIIKIIDSNGITLDSVKIMGYDISLNKITTDGFGNIYVSGYSNNNATTVIGNDTLYSDSSGPGVYYTTYFLVKLHQDLATAIGITPARFSNAAKLFPNPTKGIINLEFGEEIQEGKVGLYNVSGGCLLTKQIQSAKTIQLDISGFARGIYFIEINNGGEKTFKKVVLE